ncbi:L-threonylcarbamoyladenylate synthase [Psychrobacter pygoscelis]|uniref:L-threonylcarbamoyladenylate synthase n=1 Tax=Psychrobacter pygoscelis TaxID=2488563 RepID=UPI00103CF30A|nr:Sua5/YciO/YrdC/YwlC family protein [Psychrobacter pygoscelis]
MPTSNDINATHSTASRITRSATEAAEMLRQGALLAYPTESVWGIGCDAYCEAAVMQVLTIKQRPMDKGMIVITDSAERITALLAGLSKSQRSQVVSSWQDNHRGDLQQAQTWLLPVPSSLTVSVPKWITGQHPSVAVRVITHPLIRQLCAQLISESNPFGFIVSTSCNPSGQPPATTINEAYGYFGKQIGYLDAPTLGYTQPSRIRDALTGQTIR